MKLEFVVPLLGAVMRSPARSEVIVETMLAELEEDSDFT